MPCQVLEQQPEVKEITADDRRFMRYVENKVKKTIKQYDLLKKEDKIAVAVSGGKDSTTALYILKKLGYAVEALSVDVRIGCYTEENLKNLHTVCKDLGIKLNIISFIEEFKMSLCLMQEVLKRKGHKKSSCTICGVLRRHLLNKHARKLGYDVLATGHNLDDEAQSFVMNVFRNDLKLARRQGPKSGTTSSKRFVQRVKPLYGLKEEEIIRYSRLRKFPVHYGMCPCSKDAYRRDYLNVLNFFEKKNPHVKYNVVKFHEQMIALMPPPIEKAENLVDCSSCGEPAATERCKACEILYLVNKAPAKK
ncbi:MAG: TIGR00269 family protein [Nanoarchaeota archaeon]